MSPSEQVIEFLDAGVVECPACGYGVQMVARVINRDTAGMPTIDQERIGRCGDCGAQLEWPLAPHGLG